MTAPPRPLQGLLPPTVTSGRAHTKVVATIGPASEHRLPELIDAGLSVARINFSHGEPEDHRRRVQAIRAAAKHKQVALGILADIQGPKLRLGLFQGGSRQLGAGESVRLREGAGIAENGEVLFNFEGGIEALQLGQRVLLADGACVLFVEDKKKDHVRAVVRRAGMVGDRKGVHLPDTTLSVPFPTPKDKIDISLARELGVDMLGLSYVSSGEEIRRVRQIAPEQLIVSKIERAAALMNIESILAETDGVMVARGDLGVEIELEQLPMVQKSLIQAALKAGRFTITATEMLESMVVSSRPTRAEVTDIANAVLDGTDAIMLSAETAVGQYPVEAVEVMVKIARAVELSQRYHDLPRVSFRTSEPTFSNAVAKAAVEAAEVLGLAKIVSFTETGNSVRLLSRYRPSAEIIALTPSERTLNQMAILAHVRPFMFPRMNSLEDMLTSASKMLLERGVAKVGEEVIFIAGVPPGVSRTTNMLKLHRIGEQSRLH